MSKISVLMNCYNGAKYLKEAIDSVYSQTFTDWEIVFIDNCSTDNSAEIAKSYGEKIKYYKTEKNIPLGAARNFGLKYCEGEFISFLDTDDIWFSYTLSEQLEAIESKKYALVYGNQVNINKNSEIINVTNINFKEGNIFPDLLEQFDIPIVTTMLRKEILEKEFLNFDINVHGSEEYCLFMQLAVKNEFKVILKPLVKYRILATSLTNKSIEFRSKDRVYTLNKIQRENIDIEKKFKVEYKEAYARADYYNVQYLISIKKIKEARKVLCKYWLYRPRYFLLNILLYMPLFFWYIIQKIKYKR